MTIKGQVTIPADLRRILALHQGDRVQFRMQNDEIVVRKYNKPVEELFGLFAVKHKVSDQDMKQAILQGAHRANRA